MAQIATYKEIKVVYDRKGEIIDRQPSKRDTVRIDEHTANVNNTYSKSTGLLYELVEEKKPIRRAVKQK